MMLNGIMRISGVKRNEAFIKVECGNIITMGGKVIAKIVC